MQTPSPPTPAAPPTLDRRLLALLTVTAAITVGNLYLAQPLLAEIGHQLHASTTATGTIVTLAQVGYGLGVLFIVPLGDLLERSRLILVLLGGVTASLLLAAAAPTLPLLSAACLLIGITTVVPQIVIPYTASLAPDDRRSSILGTVQGGLLIGILLARTFSGAVASLVGWRGVFVAAAVLCALLGLAVWLRFPRQKPHLSLSYGAVLRSLAHLRHNRVLMRVSLAGALSFAVFTSFWTTLPFLLESAYGKGPGTAGLFGIVGAVGALAAGLAGRLADRKGERWTQWASLVVVLLAFVPFWFAGHSMIALIIAVVIMDAGIQASHIALQAQAFNTDHHARSRINGVYMFIRFAGGAAGSALGAVSWSHWGWRGFCVSGLLCLVASFVPLIE
ncbi:MAG TPA: MFS transporter [Polyangia bacterium]|jgi:predicted MFS family arabinose efflux permease|nr:MFS transporter [Polyangia bacterium]